MVVNDPSKLFMGELGWLKRHAGVTSLSDLGDAEDLLLTGLAIINLRREGLTEKAAAKQVDETMTLEDVTAYLEMEPDDDEPESE